MKDFSIIVLTYKSADVIKKNLASIFAQTMPTDHFEIILVDDASNDGTGLVLSELAKNNNKIRLYLMKKRRGNGYCKNFAIGASAGRYLFFLDDHLFLQDRDVLSKMFEALKRNKGLVGVCGNYVSANKKDYNICRDIRRFMIYGKREHNLILTPGEFIPFSIVISLFRKKDLNKIKNFSQNHITNAAEDTYFQIQQHKKGRNFLYLASAAGFHSHNANLRDATTKMKRELMGYACILVKFSRDTYFNGLFLPSFFSFPLLLYLAIVLTAFHKIFLPLLVVSVCSELVLLLPVFFYKIDFITRIRTLLYCFVGEFLKGPLVLFILFTHPGDIYSILRQLCFWEINKFKYIYEYRLGKFRPYQITIA